MLQLLKLKCLQEIEGGCYNRWDDSKIQPNALDLETMLRPWGFWEELMKCMLPERLLEASLHYWAQLCILPLPHLYHHSEPASSRTIDLLAA